MFPIPSYYFRGGDVTLLGRQFSDSLLTLVPVALTKTHAEIVRRTK